MKTSKAISRALLFSFLIAALCGNFAFPVLPVQAAPQSAPAPGEIVISEFRTSGPAGTSDEFIELYNVTAGTVDISGLEVWGSNGNANPTTSRRLTITNGTILQPGQHYLIANNGYSNASVPANQTYGTAIADNGGIALRLPTTGTILDQVGMSNNSAYKEGTFLPPLNTNTNSSYERKPGGAGGSCTDTGDNSSDFGPAPISPSDPQNIASAPVYCAGLQTFTPTSPAISTDTPTPTSTATATDTPTGIATATDTPTGTPTGTATSTPTGTPTGTSTLPPGSATSVVISEFRTRGSEGANDEFIELYNPTSAPIDISGWKISSSNDSGNKETKATIPAATLLRSGQYYLIANNNSSGGYSKGITPDLTYGTSITDTGGIALLKADGTTIVDQVGMSAGTVYKEGNFLSSLTTNLDQSYERKLGGDLDSCQDTNNNSNDFNKISPSNPQNYTSQLSLCGVHQSPPAQTTITITAHSPNPSLINRGVSVSVNVTVLYGSYPTGTVNITGANTNCSITLTTASQGKGSCTVYFSTLGTKSLVATYLGSNSYLKSTSAAVSHQVVSTLTTPTPTRPATPIPPPPLVAINEFVPRPGHDWNHDGVVNTGDEYIELLNHGVVNVSLSGYSIDDEVNIGSSPYRLPAVTIKPGERIVFYGSETGLLLSDGGDAVRLLKPNGQLADAYNYRVVGYPDQSFCRLPDNGGADDWNQNCFPTPGLQNSLSGEIAVPVSQDTRELYCPIADTLPNSFAQAECAPFGNNIWNQDFWDKTGWYGNKPLPGFDTKWQVFAN